MFRRIIAAGALAALGLCACTKLADTSSGPAAAHNTWTTPGRLVISAAADPKNLDPVLDASQPTLELSMFMFSYTVRYDQHEQPYPDAVSEIPTVENGDVSKDGLTLKYKLRHDIKWHDGQPLTCNDLRFTWQVVMNKHNNVVTTDGYNQIQSVDCSDPYVAVVHMKKLYAPFLQQLWSINGNAPILPEHILAKYNDDKGSFNTAPFQSAPVGSGPFKFVSWERGSSVRMEVNPNYFLGKPGLNEVVYKIIPDGNTLVTQLETHEVDLGFNLPLAQWNREKAIPGTVAIAPVIHAWTHMDFNLHRPIFADVRLRRALTYALDRPALLEKVGHGLGELSDTFMSPTLYPDAYNHDVMKYPYDPAKARALLDEAGWKVGPDGIRVKNGQRLTFQISTQTESVTGKAVESQTQAMWRAVGADAVVKNYPTSLFFENNPREGILQGGKYDIAYFVWNGAPDIDQAAILSNKYFPPGQNTMFWNNQLASDKIADANSTVDQKRRVADYMVVQAEFAKDDPQIVLWFEKYPIVWNADLKGITATTAITPPFWNTWQYHD
jgi:peptide/nickel transport system substrate-binding protein